MPACLEQNKEPLEEFSGRIRIALRGQKTLVKTAGGRLGLARYTSVIGDLVCILKGCSIPIIIPAWPTPDSKKYVLIGEAYIHGIMDGEMELVNGSKGGRRNDVVSAQDCIGGRLEVRGQQAIQVRVG